MIGNHNRSQIDDGGTLLNRLKRPRRDDLLFAVSLNVALLLGLFFFRGIVFDTLDDYNLMLSISGEKTGEPFWQLTYFNSLYAFIIAFLYRITSIVQWYTIIELALVLVSLTTVLCCLYARLLPLGFNRVQVSTVYLIVYICLFLYPTQRMQFTTTASLLGTAACACLLSIPAEIRSSSALKAHLLAFLTLLAMSLIERKSAGICSAIIACACLVRTALLLWSKDNLSVAFSVLKNNLMTLFIPVIVCTLFLGGHELVLAFGPNADYMDYDEWRVRFQDYPHPSFDEAEDLYRSVGWTSESYSLTQSLIFIDDHVNEQAFMTIMSSDEAEEAQLSFFQAIRKLASFYKHDATAKCVTLFILGSAASVFILCLSTPMRRRSRTQEILAVGSTSLLIFYVLLVVYLALKGRFVLRALLTVSLPVAMAFLFLLIDSIQESVIATKQTLTHLQGNVVAKHMSTVSTWNHGAVPFSHEQIKTSMARGIVALVIGAFCFGLGAKIEYSAVKALGPRDVTSLARLDEVENYADSHPEAIYLHDYSICNVYNSEDPFRSRGYGGVSNLILSGGSYTYTACWKQQLKANGLTEMTGQTLLLPNVYFITDTTRGGNYASHVLDYLRDRYGEVQMEEVERLGYGVAVYKYQMR